MRDASGKKRQAKKFFFETQDVRKTSETHVHREVSDKFQKVFESSNVAHFTACSTILP
jgi:hypothetical protein